MMRERLARSSSVLNALKRLFSSSQQGVLANLPAAVLEQLAGGVPLTVQKFSDEGRGLVASRDIQHGEVLLMEQPFVCCPALSNKKRVCYHCLRLLPAAQQPASPDVELPVSTRSHTFCSQSCLSRAQAAYYTLEAQLATQQLEQYCAVYGERFPLMAARLAFIIAQDAMLSGSDQQSDRPAAGQSEPGPIGRLSSNSNASTSKWSSTNLGTISSRSSTNLHTSSWGSSAYSRTARVAGRADSLALSTKSCAVGPGSAMHQQVAAALGFLCFANVPPPPPAPWQEAHKLISKALRAAVGMREREDEAAGLATAVQLLDLDWYVAVMARLHLNTFKVDAVTDIDWSQGHAAAAAMLGGDAASAGSALYLLGSLFNHSCEPNVLVAFPRDSTAVFTAARQIAAGEQLFITYIDAEQEVDARQQYLAFAYGFRCRCARCQEELAAAAQNMPPQLA